MTATEQGLMDGLWSLTQAVESLEAHRDASASLEPLEQASAIALVKDLRQRLSAVEADLSTTLGKAEGQMAGNLPDGRQFTLKRTADRTQWNHDDWKRDVRRAITAQVEDRFLIDEDGVYGRVIDTSTGETVTLGRVIQEALIVSQNVHGSAEPKSTALKPLGLYKGDYCTSSPGGWILNVIKPSPTTETTTTKES